MAERAGVSIGSLYQYFPSKDAILVALMEQSLTLFSETLSEAIDGAPGESEAALRALVRLVAPGEAFAPTATLEVPLSAGPVHVELDTSGAIDVAAERARLGKLDPGVGLLSKPYRKHELATRIREALDG